MELGLESSFLALCSLGSPGSLLFEGLYSTCNCLLCRDGCPSLAVLLVCSVMEPPEQSVKVDVLDGFLIGRKFFSMSRSFYLPAAWDSVAFTFPVCCWSFVPWTVGKTNTCYYKILLPRGVNEGTGTWNSLV